MLHFSVKKYLSLALAAVCVLSMSPALAHTGGHLSVFGFGAGFAHPFSGMDHLFAMLAVGLWASQNKRPALWILPILFPLMMAMGAMFGMAHGSFDDIETGIALTVAILGLFVAFSFRLPIMASAGIISLFALLHGVAHGAELPQGVSSIGFVAGFMTATALLHIIGVGIGLVGNAKFAPRMIRLVGVAIASAGVYLMIGV